MCYRSLTDWYSYVILGDFCFFMIQVLTSKYADILFCNTNELILHLNLLGMPLPHMRCKSTLIHSQDMDYSRKITQVWQANFLFPWLASWLIRLTNPYIFAQETQVLEGRKWLCDWHRYLSSPLPPQFPNPSAPSHSPSQTDPNTGAQRGTRRISFPFPHPRLLGSRSQPRTVSRLSVHLNAFSRA